MKLSALLLTALAIAGVSCNTATVVTPVVVELKKETYKNLSYGTDDRKILDVSLPAKRGTTTPFIILIHSGVWISGDKSELSALQDSLCNNGIASININYRFASQTVHLSDMMSDVAEALAFARKNASAWALNLDKIAVGGVSSGAQMALMYGMKYDTNGSINCIVSGAAPSAIDDRNFLDGAVLGNGITGINYMVGATYAGTGQPIDTKFTEASPIKNLKNVPMLLLHGTSDEVVPYYYSKLMDDTLTSLRYTHSLVTLNGVGHDLGLGNSTSTVYRQIEDWIKKYEIN